MSVSHRLVFAATCQVTTYDDGIELAITCLEPQVAVAEVPVNEGTVELALCAEHLAELKRARDPIRLAQMWLP